MDGVAESALGRPYEQTVMITSFRADDVEANRQATPPFQQAMGNSTQGKVLQITAVSPDGEVILRAKYDSPTTISMGRGVDCDLLFDQFGKKLSRCHAVVLHDGTDWEFYNLGMNGSYESGEKVDSVILRDSNVIRLGKRGPIVQFKFVQPLEDPSTEDPSTEIEVDLEEDVTTWIRQIRSGDDEAAQRLWDRYFDDILEVARNSLRDSSRRVQDEEDVAIVAFRSLLAGIAAGRFKGLDHREQLWRLLMVITTRKAAALIERDQRQKRGGGDVRGDSAFLGNEEKTIPGQEDSSTLEPGFDGLRSDSPTPDIAAVVADETRQLIASLDDELAQNVAVLKMEGYTHDEIAKKLSCTTRTVERRIKQIREQWQHMADSEI
jgi:RNA polymerase sigma factor (sigma-70 family)